MSENTEGPVAVATPHEAEFDGTVPPKVPGIEWVENGAEYLHKSGLLAEINRTVLHPYGLAIAIHQNDDGTFQPGAWLMRDVDPEGIVFAEERLLEVRRRLEAFKGLPEIAARLRARQRALGYLVQPAPDETGETVEIDREDDGRWLASVPAVPGALAYGNSAGEAVEGALHLAKVARAEGTR